MTGPLCDASTLARTLDHVVLLDARTGPSARGDYEKAHLPGARFVDLEHDLVVAGTDPAHGGRHPLPPPEAFARTLGRLGVARTSDVVIYDAANGANAAARAWWMLRALGHDRVRVLEGGLDAALAAGIRATAEPSSFEAVDYPAARSFAWPTIDADEVARWTHDPDRVVIDVRSAPRYRGETEPIDPIAGHIPGARNVFHLDHLAPDGTMRSGEEIAAQLREAIGDRAIENVAVHCGSGVTACFTILAMAHAELGVPALYVGSWGEWCRQPRPRASGSEP